MALTVTRFDDAAAVVEFGSTVEFLCSRPAENNLVATLLEIRVEHPEPGRYWVVERAGDVVGVAFQSPLHYPMTLTPMSTEAARALVAAVVDDDIDLPGASGQAATAAAFAGAWAEATSGPARPIEGQRIHEVTDVVRPVAVAGTARLADETEIDLLVEWWTAFEEEAGALESADVRASVEQRLAERSLFVWETDTEVVSLAGTRASVFDVARIAPVYTPPRHRRRGFAAALVAELSQQILDRGDRCMLYTDLANATSNGVYRRIGYQASVEVLRYSFGDQ